MMDSKPCRLFCLGAAVALGYFLLRSATGLVWDDTPKISSVRHDRAWPFVFERSVPWRTVFALSFGELDGSGYRPVNVLQEHLGRLAFGRGEPRLWPWFAAAGVLFGLMAVCVYLVARRFLGRAAALFAVFLVLFSGPVVSGAWPVVFGIQAAVPLLICLGLLTYWRLVEATAHRAWYAAGLVVLLIIGPWVREFIGLLTLLIAFEEFRRARRPTWVAALAGVLFLHALFPTALVKWLAYPRLPLKPVFALGNLSQVLTAAPGPSAGGVLSRLLHGLKWDAADHFLVLYPPLLLILAGAAYGAQSAALAFRRDGRFCRERLLALRPVLPLLLLLLVPGVLFLAQSPLRGFCLVMGLAALTFRVAPLLGVWFLFAFLPFLKVFTEQVHLAYAVVPASMGLAGILEKAYAALGGAGAWPRLLRAGVTAVLLVTVGDHALTLYGSCRVVTSCNRTTEAVARWFRANVPAGSVVIGNVLHLEEMRLASGGHFTAYWTAAAGAPHQGRVLEGPAALEKILKENQGKRAVYFLDVDFPYTPDKAAYHAHKFVRYHSVAVERVGMVRALRVRYPYLDPLKARTPRAFLSFLGAPDLENDYYRGPAQDGTPFLREVYAEYHVYRVTGTRVDPWTPTGPVQLVQQGYSGFNLVAQNGRYFATPEAEGDFDVGRFFRADGYSACFRAGRVEDLRAQIDDFLACGAAEAAPCP